MGSKLSQKDNDLYKAVDEVLHYLWDPIGISDEPGARDEYRSYLPGVFNLLKQNEPPETIAQCLLEISVDRMGFEGDYKHDLEIAEVLLNWKKMIEAKAE